MEEISILCLLPEEVKNKQLEIRQKIAKEFNLVGVATPKIPAHITLKYKFPAKNLNEIEKNIREICKAEKPTRFSIQGFNYFNRHK